MGDVDKGGSCAHVGVRGYGEISVPSFQFCLEPKTSLKTTIQIQYNTIQYTGPTQKNSRSLQKVK